MNALFLLLAKDGLPALHLPAWNDFANALAAADQGDASAFSTPLATSPTESAGLAINCADYPPEIVTYEDFVAKTILGRAVAPHTQGASEAWLGLLACMRWPVPVTPTAQHHGAWCSPDPAGRLDARPGDRLRVGARAA